MRPARLLVAAVTSALLAGIPALTAPTAVAQQSPDPSAAAEKDLRSRSTGRVTVRRDDRGVVHFVGTEPGKPAKRPEQVAAEASAAQKAAAHVKRYGALWALDHKGAAVRARRTQVGANGQSVVRFQQTVNGMPVFGGELAVALDKAGNLQSVSGETTPLAVRAGELRISAEQAQRTAVNLAARVHKAPAGALVAGAAEPYAYDAELLAPSAKDIVVPVWKLEVTGPAHVRHLVLVDRQNGAVALNYNQVHGALYRVVCDRKNVRDTTNPDGSPKLAACTSNFARVEGGAPNVEADVNAAYDYAGDTARYFDEQFNVDLTQLIGHDTGVGKRIRSTVRYCFPSSIDPQCPMLNAFWNGNGVYYSAGMAKADDIVAHELSHGVTEHTSNLAYWYQSGAINESMSDVFGELVDLNNVDAETEDPWKLGEGSPFGVVRDMANPTATQQPDRMQDPAGYYAGEDAEYFDNGGVHTNSGVGNKAAYLIARESDEGPVLFNGQTITGIGHVKAAEIYYKALQMLTSGADYQDLYSVLPQACDNLAAGGVDGIVANDCNLTVRKAVTATQMNLQPKSSDAAAPEAPTCTAGTKKDMFLDGFGSAANWAYTSGRWNVIDYYARSGKKSFYGHEYRASGQPRDSYARISKAFTVPSGAPAFLRFDHQYGLAYWPGDAQFPDREYYAGARLLYSTDGGKTWKTTSYMTWSNGPDKTITPYDANGNPQATYKAFGGDSHGYQSSRLDVSPLAGKSVIFRWHIKTDFEFYYDGWTLDDVNLYVCGGATPTSVYNLNTIGGVGRATVQWSAPVWPGQGGLTKYRVTVKRGDTTVKAYDVAAGATSTTVSGLSRGTTYRFHVQPFSAAGAGPSVSRGLIGTTVYSSLSPTTISSGQSVKFSGKVVRVDSGNGVKGLRIWLQGRRKGSTSWSYITSVTSGSGGAYSFIRKPTASWEYRAVYKSGYSTYMGATSNIRTVTVR